MFGTLLLEIKTKKYTKAVPNMSTFFPNLKINLIELSKRDPELLVYGACEHRYRLLPRIEEHKVNDFEKKYQLKLPDDYREFIIEHGNGGAGPEFGILPFEPEKMYDFRLESEDSLKPGELFPHRKAWNAEWIASFDFENERPEDSLLEQYWSTDLIAGSVFLSHYGHGDIYILVVKGYEAGHVWFDGRANYSGVFPENENGKRLNFSEWYLDWLDKALNR